MVLTVLHCGVEFREAEGIRQDGEGLHLKEGTVVSRRNETSLTRNTGLMPILHSISIFRNAPRGC